MQVSWARLPFKFQTLSEYEARLNEMIGTLFYDLLPAHGYDVREEQIFTAFQIARAMVRGKVLLAEAGLGTGKTLAYLGVAICHARLKGQPVIVASATGVLQEQLLDPKGDLAILSRVLNLEVDARLAMHPTSYICDVKTEHLENLGLRRRGLTRLLRWGKESPTGHRAEIPEAGDALWGLVAWDPSMPCDTCPRRGFCRLTQARQHYRGAADLVICDHDLFFRDLWSRRERQEAGLQPLLPPYSGVILDEGHDAPEAAQRAAGFFIQPDLLAESIDASHQHSKRASLLRAAAETHRAARTFWKALEQRVEPEAAERLHIRRDAELASAATALSRAIAALQDELATEEAMFQETTVETRVLAMQARFDQMIEGLGGIAEPPEESILWAERLEESGYRVWAVPRRLDEMLQRELYRLRVPVVFSSATIAAGTDFTYFKRLIGAPDALQAQVGTPFDLEEQALVYLPQEWQGEDPAQHLLALLAATDGRALVLVRNLEELAKLKAALAGRELPWRIFWEDEGERADLVRRFEAERSSVLVGYSFWEGIDVPGESLSAVVVLRLPFPPHDPVITARREHAVAAGLDPFQAVDVPTMAVRLKQGRGRLIRARTDRGVFALLDTSFVDTPYEEAVRAAFPEEAQVVGDLGRVAGFLRSVVTGG